MYLFALEARLSVDGTGGASTALEAGDSGSSPKC